MAQPAEVDVSEVLGVIYWRRFAGGEAAAAGVVSTTLSTPINIAAVRLRV